MRVLTLLADEYDLDRFKKRLALSGYHVIQAKTEQEAWDVLQRDKIQVIVFDCDLAKTALLEQIRRLEHSGYIYAFALIAPSVMANVEENERTTFVDEYIVKPVEPDELIARLSVVDRYIRTLSALRAKNDPPEPIRDSITGTFTQSTIIELLSAEISRSKRSHKPFALALLALDNIDELAVCRRGKYFDNINSPMGQNSDKTSKKLHHLANSRRVKTTLAKATPWLGRACACV